MGELNVFRASEKYSKRVNGKEPNALRTDFRLDKERILHSTEFRRLSGKTQVFVCGFDENMRTRLTHTIEVAHISAIISEKMELNTILSEAISYAHDVGHTPFGHAGEDTLNQVMNGCIDIGGYNKKQDFKHGTKGFKHNWQGVRVVVDLEKISDNYNGLNLTNFTIYGILNHSKLFAKDCEAYAEESNICIKYHNGKDCTNNRMELDYYDKYNSMIDFKNDWTIESIIVDLSDEISQRHHDIEDGIRAKLVDKTELLIKFEEIFIGYLSAETKERLKLINVQNNKDILIEDLSRIIIDTYINQTINDLSISLTDIQKAYHITKIDDFHKMKEKIYENFVNSEQNKNFRKKKKIRINDFIGLSSEFKKCDDKFQKYLISRIIKSHVAQSMDGKSVFIIRKLFSSYFINPQQLSDKTIKQFLINFYADNGSELYEEKSVGESREELEKLQRTQNNIKYKTVLLRTICDHVAGMSDKYALDQFEILYGTKYAHTF